MSGHLPVTHREIARRIGCDKSTVSLALRGSTRISTEVRERIHKVATELGYRPDPMLSALSHYRLQRESTRTATTLAYLVHLMDKSELVTRPVHRSYLAGARAHAEKLGFNLEVFAIGAGDYEPRRLGGVLQARGIPGVIVASFAPDLPTLDLPWSEFCSVKIGYHPPVPRTHIVAHNHFQFVRAAMRELHAKGFRRVALATSRYDRVKLQSMFLGGYFLAQHELFPAKDWVQPIVFDDGPRALWEIGRTLQRERVEVLLSNYNFPPGEFVAAGLDPKRVRFCCLDVPPDRPELAGIVQNHAVVGARVVDQLALMVKTNQWGLPEVPNLTLIDGAWRDGDSLAACRTWFESSLKTRKPSP